MSNNKQIKNFEKDFAPYEEALALKEIGFDEPCFGYWYTEQEDCKKVDVQISTVDFLGDEPDYILAPTFSQAFRWFREKYGRLGCIQKSSDRSSFIYFVNDNIFGYYDTYEEAELACLRRLIEIVKEKNNEQQ